MVFAPNSFLLFEVDIGRLTYITFALSEEYEYLERVFDNYDVRAQIQYKGPSEWTVDIYEEIRELNELFETDNYESFPLYKNNYFNDVWENIKITINDINYECRKSDRS